LNAYRVEFSPEELDVGLCLTSGQIFRWNFVDGVWKGFDGAHRYEIQPRDGGADVVSTADATAFRSFFRLDHETAAIRAEVLRIEPEMGPLLDSFRGLRVLRTSSATELLVSFLCTPNNHLARIVPMVEFLAAHGESSFPSLMELAAVEEAKLRAAGFGYRGATIPAAIGQLVSRGGEAYLNDLKAGRIDEARQELMSLPGVGAKVADCILLFALDFLEAAPIDTHVWRAMTWRYEEFSAAPKLDPRTYRLANAFLRDRFGPVAGWIQQFLFMESLTANRRKVDFKR
jgi:N-glycosylase/DNA lyase